MRPEEFFELANRARLKSPIDQALATILDALRVGVSFREPARSALTILSSVALKLSENDGECIVAWLRAVDALSGPCESSISPRVLAEECFRPTARAGESLVHQIFGGVITPPRRAGARNDRAKLEEAISELTMWLDGMASTLEWIDDMLKTSGAWPGISNVLRRRRGDESN